MIEEVKMIMDEQTKRTVDSLRTSLEEVFAPLRKLEGLDSRLSEIGGEDKLVSAVRRSIEDVQDSIDGLSGKIATFVSMQETIIAAIGEIKSTLAALREPVAKIPEQSGKKGNVDVKKALLEKSTAKATKKTTVVMSNNHATKRKAKPGKDKNSKVKAKRGK